MKSETEKDERGLEAVRANHDALEEIAASDSRVVDS